MKPKLCFKCLCHLPIDEFYKHPAMADGHLNKCKVCTKKDVSLHRLQNINRVREYDRTRGKTPERIKKNIERTREWRKRNPERWRAHMKLNNALKKGTVKKLPCFMCGNNAEAHHPDYNRPLSVVWLCSAHHKQAHALGNKLNRGET